MLRPPALFIGRDADLEQLRRMLERVPIASVCGVGGVGKSALVAALAARWTGPVLYHRALSDESAADVLDALRRAAARGPVSQADDDAHRLADLSQRVDADRSIVVVDDVHRLDCQVRAVVFGELGRLLQRGRLVVTSRELLGPSPELDSFTMRLGGIDEPSARTLWAKLDELYGPSAGFDRAWARWRGNPFLLRRAHAGELSDEDPVAAALTALNADERRVALALALVDTRLPLETLAQLELGAPLRPVLRRLVKLLVVDVDGMPSCTVHDLFRDALLAAATPDEARALRRELARVIRGAPLDEVLRFREVARLLATDGDWDALCGWVLDHATTLVRAGAANELLRGLETIPAPERTSAVRVAHARTLGRVMQPRRSLDELRRLADVAPELRDELRMATVQAALDLGDLDEGLRVVAELLTTPRLTETLRSRAEVARCLLTAHGGRFDEARELARRAAERDGSAAARGIQWFAHAFVSWLERRDAEAAESMERALALFEESPVGFRGRVLAPAFCTSLYARLGRIEDARAAYERTRRLLERHTDLRMRLYLEAMRADLLLAEGERLAALTSTLAVADRFERAGYMIGAVTMRARAAELMFLLGQRATATQLLEALATMAERSGVRSILPAIARARRRDAVVELVAGSPAPLIESDRVRTVVLDALRAAGRGDGRATATLERVATALERPDFAVDRAIALVARATFAMSTGDDARSAELFAAADEVARGAGADGDYLQALRRALGRVRIVTPTRNVVAAEAPALDDYDVVVDGRAHTVRIDQRVVSLKRSTTLRRLLYALARQPGQILSKEQLVASVWNAAYNPLVHDNSMFVAVRRLRQLLADSGLELQFVGEGYRLDVSPRFVFVDEPR